MSSIVYGNLNKRIKAVIIDSIVLAGLGLLASNFLGKYENVPDSIRLLTFILIFLLYDPLFTSFVGGTIGHLFTGLGVRREQDETMKIIFPFALIRFVFKAFLGWISLLTVSGNKKSKAIHDSIVGSIVIEIN